MKKLIACLMVFLLMVAPLEAGCRVFSHAAVVVEQVVTPVYAPIAVFAVPAYAVGYLPPPAPAPVIQQPVVQTQPQVQVAPQAVPAMASCEQRAAQLEARVGQLEALLRNNQSPGNLPLVAQPSISQPQSQAPRGLAIMQSKCASCHEAAVAKEKGVNFTLFKGSTLMPLDGGAQAKVLKQVYSGRMPKGGKLTDEEVAEVIGLIDQMK